MVSMECMPKSPSVLMTLTFNPPACQVHYLWADDSADGMMWGNIRSALRDMGRTLDGSEAGIARGMYTLHW